jgi:hypothetical protein
MLTGLDALESVNWWRLSHAYGRATDTPAHLRALLGDDSKARKLAINHLWSAIIHQGTPWTATGPTALVVAGLVADERIDRVAETPAALLRFLVSVAAIAVEAERMSAELERQVAATDLEPLIELEDDDSGPTESAFYDAIFENEAASNAYYARSLLGCVSALAVIEPVMTAALTFAQPRVRAVAAAGVVTLAKDRASSSDVAVLCARLRGLADAATDKDERAAYVMALGELGASTSTFLEDPSPGVRLCAALAPGLHDDPRAIEELIGALEKHAGEIDGWFAERPLPFNLKVRFYVVKHLVEQIQDFDRLTSAAIAVVRIARKQTVDFDWGPLLASAFPNGDGVVATKAQRDFLKALVANEWLWDPKFANPIKWFKAAGLPYDREACTTLTKTT